MKIHVVQTISLLLISQLVLHSDATSQGVATFCDATANVGCSTWTNGKRNACNDANAGPMKWASKPVRSPLFTVRSGDEEEEWRDPSNYAPGSLMPVHVRALQYGLRFRGILIHAVNAKGDSVGSWEFPPNDDEPTFHSPSACPHALLHSGAGEKPYHSRLLFRAPLKGTGRITFKTLLKTGPANTGAFYYPNKDLVLDEGSRDTQQWVLKTAASQSCEEQCLSSGLGPANQADLILSDPTAFAKLLTRSQVCKLPVVASCAADAPAVGASSAHCYYRDTADSCLQTSGRKSSLNPLHAATSVCPCGTATLEEPARPPSLLSTGSSTARPSSVLAVVLALLTVGSLAGGPSDCRFSFRVGCWGRLALCVVACLALLPGASAHNWISTPGRASRVASTVFPCQGRKASDLHAQVAPNQPFAIRWATGHERDTYFVVVKGSDEHWLAHRDFEAMVDDYISLAPTGQSLHLEDDTRRYHSAVEDNPSFLSSTDTFYQAKLATPSISHPRDPTLHMWRYKDSSLSGDKRVAYASDKYPWIEAAHRYEHLEHLPYDLDVVNMKIPATQGPGHYVVHWRWSGYYDCMDVDVRNGGEVAQPYGEINQGAYKWSKVDHCQYVDPAHIETHCLEQLTGDVQMCMDGLPSWKDDRYRLGVQVVPLVNPPSVYRGFRGVSLVPWNRPSCVGHDWTVLTGTVSRSEGDRWSNWRERTTVKEGQSCSQKSVTESSFGAAGDTKWLDNGQVFDAAKGYGWSCPGAACTWCTVGGSDTAENTFVRVNNPEVEGLPDHTCADGSFRQWEAQVPNGVYEVSLYVKGYGDGVAINGCHAQGTRLRPYPETESSNGETFSVPDGTTVTQRVHVRQGRLRIGASPAPPESDAAVCSYINKLSFARVGGAEALPQAWIPDAQSPWQQLALAAATPIGVVTVTLPEYTGCAHTWLFDGNSCVRGARSIGAFLDTASQGAVVGVSNNPCTSSGCSGTVCGRIDRVWPDQWNSFHHVDCGGKSGKYVYVLLPGSNRILAHMEIRVNRATPSPAKLDNNSFVCYGLQARTQTALEPEYVVTADPEDPIFYSTCYVREVDVTWLPGSSAAAPAPRWRHNGKCVDCKSFHSRVKDQSESSIPVWKIADKCLDCEWEGELPPEKGSGEREPLLLYTGARCREDKDTCSTGTPACLKRLFPHNRGWPPSSNVDYHSRWENGFVSVEECQLLAKRDRDCSPRFAHNGNDCYCQRNAECCGKCVAQDTQSWAPGFKIFDWAEAARLPDPTCAKGVQSEDGSMCCSNACVDTDGKSVCGVEWWCEQNVANGKGDSCCKHQGLQTQCSASSAPCLL